MTNPIDKLRFAFHTQTSKDKAGVSAEFIHQLAERIDALSETAKRAANLTEKPEGTSLPAAGRADKNRRAVQFLKECSAQMLSQLGSVDSNHGMNPKN